MSLVAIAQKASGWIFVALLAMTWQLVGARDATGLFPPLSEVLARAWEILTSDSLTEDILPSIARAVVGFVLGSLLAIVLGLALGWLRSLRPWLLPVLDFCRAVPPPALVPLSIALFGATNTVKIAIIALGAFWPVLINTIDGARRVDPVYIDSAHVYTRAGSFEIVRRVVLPAAAPQIVSGLRIGLAVALVLMVVSEMFGASSGLGYIILQSQRIYDLTSMYAGVLILGSIGLLLTSLFSRAERQALAWFEGMKGREA